MVFSMLNSILSEEKTLAQKILELKHSDLLQYPNHMIKSGRIGSKEDLDNMVLGDCFAPMEAFDLRVQKVVVNPSLQNVSKELSGQCALFKQIFDGEPQVWRATISFDSDVPKNCVLFMSEFKPQFARIYKSPVFAVILSW